MDWYESPSSLGWPDDDVPPAPKYRLCRAGFALVGIGLALLAFSAAVEVGLLLAVTPALFKLIHTGAWKWLIGAPISWATLLGAYLLWGGMAEAGWRRRAGLLLLLNAIDAIQWTIENNEALGLRLGPLGHSWLRHQVGAAFNWAEFLLFAGLAAEVASPLEGGRAADLHRKVRTLSLAGATVWAFGFVRLTDWRHGWPLTMRPGRRVLIDAALFDLGSSALSFLTTLNIIALCVLACRRCSRALVEAKPEERGAELLQSRSETWDDTPRR